MTIKKFNRSSVEYNSETGEFHWIVCFRKPWLDGCIATRETPNGYLYIKADGKSHSASRLAIELYTGCPVSKDMVVDHIDRNTKNNKISNLNVISQKENLSKSVRQPGISGVNGVRIYNRPTGNGHMWRAVVNDTIKYFQTLEEAIAGYAKLASEACDK